MAKVGGGPGGPRPNVTTTRPQAKQGKGAGPVKSSPTKPGSRQGSVAAPPPPPSRSAGPPAGAPAGPKLGTFQAQNSKYYGDKLIDSVSGAHYDADTGQAEAALDEPRIEVEETNDLVQAAKYFGIFVVMLGIGIGAAMGAGSGWVTVITLGVICFLGGMLMPVLRAVHFAREDSDTVGMAGVLILLLGPTAGGIAYGVITALMGGPNPPLVGIFLTYIFARLGLDLATGESLDKILPFKDLTVDGFIKQYVGFMGIVGWYMADWFKKEDE
jgi:hypothetical protein